MSQFFLATYCQRLEVFQFSQPVSSERTSCTSARPSSTEQEPSLTPQSNVSGRTTSPEIKIIFYESKRNQLTTVYLNSDKS